MYNRIFFHSASSGKRSRKDNSIIDHDAFSSQYTMTLMLRLKPSRNVTQVFCLHTLSRSIGVVAPTSYQESEVQLVYDSILREALHSKIASIL